MKTWTESIRIMVLMLGILPAFAAQADDPSAANPRYVANGDTVYDKTANLTWQRCSVGQSWSADSGCVGAVKKFTFDEAQRQGGGNWRVPTKDELALLIDPERQSEPRLDLGLFPNMDLKDLYYWSSSAHGENWGMYVGFELGQIGSDKRSGLSAVRLVRTGQ